jgi:hypothetical protein
MQDIDLSSVQYAAGPLALVLGFALRPFAVWLARFLGSSVLVGVFALVSEIVPRFLGLGQGLISWGFGVAASVSFSSFQKAMAMSGVSVPSFNELLSGLPPGILWLGSVLRVDKVVFILASILVVKLFRKVAEAMAAATSKAAASSLITGGK